MKKELDRILDKRNGIFSSGHILSFERNVHKLEKFKYFETEKLKHIIETGQYMSF